MEKRRQVKILSIVALVLAIISMTLGFAAFSSTLNISSSASVSPDTSGFKVEFVPAEDRGTADSVYADVAYGEGSVDASNAKIVGTSLTGIEVSFNAPGQIAYYKVDIYNSGQYDAYLNSIDFGSKSCSATSDATESLVEAACNEISRDVTLSSSSGDYWYKTYNESVDISDVVLSPGDKISMEYYIRYADGGARADGAFDIEFGDINFNFSTVSTSNTDLISFTVSGVSYQAEEGMTWREWIDSEYNVDGFYVGENLTLDVFYGKNYVDSFTSQDTIIDGYIYELI